MESKEVYPEKTPCASTEQERIAAEETTKILDRDERGPSNENSGDVFASA
jgi:hypothetical protein